MCAMIFFISDTNKEIVCRVFFIAITIRDGRIKEIFLFARGWIHLTELSSIIVRNGGKLETFSTVFFFFFPLREKFNT